jgi:hypothetical protein
MKCRDVLGLIALLVGSVTTMSVAVPRAEAADVPCAPFNVRLDPSTWTTARDGFFGKAIGQTFLASDTLIRKITVWRIPNNRSVVGAHLYITGVDVNLVPDVGQILLNGPTVTVYDSDPPGQMIEMPFVLDPPLALPHPGVYAFFLQAAGCNPVDAWYILANNMNPYPYGMYWLTGRVDNSCHLRGVDSWEDNLDLLFDIEFCTTRVTPARAGTWGELKVLYR